MPIQTAAQTMSRTVRESLHQASPAGQVLATFDQACDLITAENTLVALVSSQVGNGPLNVVVEDSPDLFAGLEPGERAVFAEDEIHVGDLVVDLRGASVWEPRPDWRALRAQQASVVTRLPTLRTFCLEHAPMDSLLELLDETSPEGLSRRAILAAFQSAISALEAGWAGDLVRLQEGAAQLAGLGGGLTPSGDDFLTGVMLWSWLAYPAPGSFCGALAETAATLTTTLSAAFLRATARGECNAAWHALLAALSRGSDVEVVKAVQGVLAHGATSGADALAGFLWTGIQIRVDPHRASV